MDTRELLRKKRHQRVRRSVVGVSERPRLNVFRSLSHTYAQIVDDAKGRTLVSASTLDEEVKAKVTSGGTVDAAKAVGELLAQRAKKKRIKRVVFDRGGYKYHGRVKSVADAARQGGLEF